MSSKGDKVPQARLCHIVKWDDFDGYGFNLHAERGKTGQFIGKVDDGSPSQAAGLHQGDRIVEVNEINISNETHKQVVDRIKAFPNETKLLVVDQEADDYFKANNVVIRGTMPSVKVIKTPERNPASIEHEASDGGSVGSANDIEHKSVSTNDSPSNSSGGNAIATRAVILADETTTTNSCGEMISSAEAAHEKDSNGDSSDKINPDTNNISRTNENNDVTSTTMTTMTTMTTTTMTTTTTTSKMTTMTTTTQQQQYHTGNGKINENSNQPDMSLILTMSAKELRAQLAARKKYDPKKESIGFKDKFDIVQKL